MQTSNSSTVSGGERFVKNVFRGGGTIAGIGLLPVFIGLKRISSLTTILKFRTYVYEQFLPKRVFGKRHANRPVDILLILGA